MDWMNTLAGFGVGVMHHRKRSVDWQIIRRLCLGSLPAGAILGFPVTLTSVGAGALGAVMLVFLYPYRMKPTKLVGTDIVHAIPLTIVAGTGHMLMGNVDFALLGSIPGILLGTLLGSKAPEGVLREWRSRSC